MYLTYISFELIIFLITILICGLIVGYKKYVSPYSAFPSSNVILYTLKCILLRKFPSHLSPNHYIFQYVVDFTKEYQSEGLCIFWLFQPYIFVYGEKALKFFTNESTTINKPYNFDLFKDLMRNSVLSCGADLWPKRRKMLNPVFYSPNLREKSKLMNDNARRLITNIINFNEEASSDIKKFLKDCTFRNICEFLIGEEANKYLTNSELEELIEFANEFADVTGNRIAQPWLHPRCLLPFFAKGRSFLKTAKRGHLLAKNIIEKVKELSYEMKHDNEKEIDELCRNSRRSFIQVILNHHVKDPTYTSEDVEAEIIALVGAGFDTVSYALMWSLFLLGHHPDVQDHVYEEVESLMGLNNEISYDDVQNLKYLECVIKESLRLYPPVPFYGRRTSRKLKFEKYTVPAGTNIVCFAYAAHRNPTMFPDPEKFDPDRFIEGNSDKSIFIYPFAEGIRNCIGKNFAMMELKIILAHIIKNFKVISLDRREDVKLSWEIILSTVEPLRMQFIPRRHISVQG